MLERGQLGSYWLELAFLTLVALRAGCVGWEPSYN